MKKRYREKRYRPEKLISEREFLTGEHRTKQDLPTHLEVVNPQKKSSEPSVDGLTKKHLGYGKKPKWMDCCPEKEAN